MLFWIVAEIMIIINHMAKLPSKNYLEGGTLI